MTDEDLNLVRENMGQGDFVSVIGINLGKAFVSVLLILGAFMAVPYLLSLNDNWVNLTITISILSFVAVYLWVSKIPTIRDFFITDKIRSDDNNMFLISAEMASWALAVGLDLVVFVAVVLLTGDPVSVALMKIIGLSSVASVFFVYTKREDIWTATGFDLTSFIWYSLMGVAFGASTYGIGGIIVIASETIGWGMTLLGIGLEVVFTSVYTYMDLQNWVRDYKRGQISRAEREEMELKKKEDEDIAIRLSGKYNL